MIKKLSNFIVNKRIVILVTMLIPAVASMICSQFVKINEDSLYTLFEALFC